MVALCVHCLLSFTTALVCVLNEEASGTSSSTVIIFSEPSVIQICPMTTLHACLNVPLLIPLQIMAQILCLLPPCSLISC